VPEDPPLHGRLARQPDPLLETEELGGVADRLVIPAHHQRPTEGVEDETGGQDRDLAQEEKRPPPRIGIEPRAWAQQQGQQDRAE
jgi:hypothetical protein